MLFLKLNLNSASKTTFLKRNLDILGNFKFYPLEIFDPRPHLTTRATQVFSIEIKAELSVITLLTLSICRGNQNPDQ